MATEREEIALANSVIEEFGIRTKANLPVDIDRILLTKGFTVAARELPEGLVAVLDTTEKGRPLLVIDSRLSDNDARFTKARELGNYLLAKNFRGIRTDKAVPPEELISPTYGGDENRANRFAAALLMPRKLLAQSIKENSEQSQQKTSSADDGIMGALLGVGAAFAVGLGVVLLASALGGSNKK